MKYTARQAAELLLAHGITDAVVSPGSRNAPLVQALTAAFEKNAAMQVRMIVDERSAAFVALGIAQARQRPVALVCTSGTALLNYAPAVAEAFYQGVPLILLTADRPMQWIDQDDSQTIHQPEALTRIVKGNFNLPDSSDREMDWYANRILNEAILLSMDGKPGPVHVNMQFAVPLAGVDAPPSADPPRVIKEVPCEALPSRPEMLSLANRLLTKRVLVVAGFMPQSALLRKAVESFTSLPNVALLAEKTANLRSSGSVAGIDTVLGVGEFPIPDIVITLGGALVSRHVKTLLRSGTDIEHWSIDRNPYLADCFCRLSLRIKADPAPFLMSLTRLLRKEGVKGDYHALVEQRRQLAQCRQDEITAQESWSDLKAHAMIFRSLPRSMTLHCSNGTAIRYAELMAPHSLKGVYCNRGTSGIEGCTSTAAGNALASGQPTLLITGDMCFRHDLAALKVAPDNLRIIVFNNAGGDIFRFISSTKNLTEREQCFACPDLMTPSVKELANAFSFNYFRADDPAGLEQGLRKLLSAKKKGILEVDTSHSDNAGILTDFFVKLRIND